MNKSTKLMPISSPGRTEKFPPPLMRFLRSNVGSKSRRRSRASPMFSWKKNTVLETTQEPSSPKVTCIGQVRVRRSKKNKTTTATTSATLRRRHSRNRIFRCFTKLKPKSCIGVLSKWVLFFRCGFCKKSINLHDSPAIEATPTSKVAGDNGEDEKHEEKQEQKHEEESEDNHNQELISGSPPRNAFMLTRCRSAPYRSSSLAGKFWESAAGKTGEEEVVREKIENLSINEKEKEKEEEEEEEVIGNENEESRCNKSNGVEELKAAIKVAPLILTRCKSEPATTWDQLLL